MESRTWLHFPVVLIVATFTCLTSLNCDSAEEEPQSLVGSYTAIQVNGRSLPAQAFQYDLDRQTVLVDMVGATLILKADMTYRFSASFSSNAGNLSGDDEGDYTVSGGTIRFFSPEQADYSGTVRGTQLEVTYIALIAGGVPFVVGYEKQ